jgi:hypothetical protein
MTVDPVDDSAVVETRRDECVLYSVTRKTSPKNWNDLVCDDELSWIQLLWIFAVAIYLILQFNVYVTVGVMIII